MDELTMAERFNKMTELSDQLAASLQPVNKLPAPCDIDLSILSTQLHKSIAQLESEVSDSMEPCTCSVYHLIRINILLCNASKQLMELVQTVDLQRSTSNSSMSNASFATGPFNSVFCDIGYTSEVYALCHTLDAVGAPFEAAAKKRSFPDAIYSYFISGFQWYGQYRLAATCSDNSVRVFRTSLDVLFALQQIQVPQADWIAFSLVGLSDGALLISSKFTDSADSKEKWGIELEGKMPRCGRARHNVFSAAINAGHERSRLSHSCVCETHMTLLLALLR